jgi:hypothetical protein
MNSGVIAIGLIVGGVVGVLVGIVALITWTVKTVWGH